MRRIASPTLRWMVVIPAGFIAAVLVTFPIHWGIMIAYALTHFKPEDMRNPLLELLSAETVERLVIAFTTPFCAIYIGAWMAPTRRVETGIALAVVTALLLGGVYVLAFAGGPQFSGGWGSLYYGATPVLNLVGLATALYKVQRRWRM